MNYKQFQEDAKRTLTDLGLDLDLCHMALGICSELNELDDAIKENDSVNVIEELSDIHWYMACLYSICKLDFSDFDEDVIFESHTKTDLVQQIHNSSSKIANIIKRTIAYKKELDIYGIKYHTKEIVNASRELSSNYYNTDMTVGLENVINKLKVRYPNKFTSENALNRDLTKERETLEKNIKTSN